jgi:hypothetical protein
MLKGTIIDQLVVGGPAYNSRELDRGDFVEAVDSTIVDQDSILKTLIGSDTPGSMVSLTVRKGGLVGKRVVFSCLMAPFLIFTKKNALVFDSHCLRMFTGWSYESCQTSAHVVRNDCRTPSALRYLHKVGAFPCMHLSACDLFFFGAVHTPLCVY